MQAVQAYLRRSNAFRGRVENEQVLRWLNDPDVEPRLLLRFLVEHASLSVQLTEPVDGWIRRAGERCVAGNWRTIGERLQAHAHHEEGHHLLLIDDTQRLVSCWNERYNDMPLAAATMLARSPLPPMQRYIDLHEETIKGERPYLQIAIELEIERLALSWAPTFVANVRTVLGEEVWRSLHFLHAHIALDVGHTAYNESLLAAILEAVPSSLEHLLHTGEAAFHAYIDFLVACWEQTCTALEPTRRAGVG